MSAPTISIVVLTCNRLDVTKKTISYLLATTHVSYELILVHNFNGTTQSEEVRTYLKKLNKYEDDGSLTKVVKVFNKKNRGVAGGRNDGLVRSTGIHKVYIDDDILAPDCWAEEMLKVVETFPEVATIGVSVERDNFKIVSRNGVSFQRKGGNIGGAFAMLPKRTFRRLGFLCEDYGIYGFEDADLYVRVQELGKWNGYIHPLKAQHIDPENDKKYREFKNSIYNKNSKMMAQFVKNKQKYMAKQGLYIPYSPKT